VTPGRRAIVFAVAATTLIAGSIALVSALTAHPLAAVTAADVDTHGLPPTTAVVTFSFGTGDEYSETGHAVVDFTTEEVAGTLAIPELLTTITCSFVLTPTTLYFAVPSLVGKVGAAWVAVPTEDHDGLASSAAVLGDMRGSLAETSRALGAPTVTRHDGFTTSTFTDQQGHVALPPDAPWTLPGTVDLTVGLTVGPTDQFAAGRFVVSSPSQFLASSVTIQRYDRPVTITVPPPNQVRPITRALRQRVFGTTHGRLNRLLTPLGLASLLTIRVS
jgi:hypothetical protein